MLNMGLEPMTFGVLRMKVTFVSAYKTNALPTELIQLKIITRNCPKAESNRRQHLGRVP